MGYARVPNGIGTMQYQTQTYNASNQNISGITDAYIDSKIRVYPNPSNNRIYILGQTGSITILNMMGQEIYTGYDKKSVDISNWESGIYFVKSGNSVVKIIKQ